MLRWILGDIICREFDSNIGRNQGRKVNDMGGNAECMDLKFGIHIDHEKEDGYRFLEMRIFGYLNYVTVAVRESWTVIPIDHLEYNEDAGELEIKEGFDYEEGQTPWMLISHHDSCWREGVNDILKDYEDKIAVIKNESFRTWYTKKDLKIEEVAEMNNLKDYSVYREFKKNNLKNPLT